MDLQRTFENPYEPAITKQVRALRSDSAYDAILAVAKRIYGWLNPTTKDEVDTVIRFWQATIPIVKWAEGDASKEGTAAHLLGILSHLYASSVDVGPRGVVHQLRGRILQIAGSGLSDFADQGRLRVTPTESLIATGLQRQLLIKGIREYVPATSKWGNPGEAARRAAQIGSVLNESRMYGVKSCIMADGVLHAPRHAWVFLDGTNHARQLPAVYHPGFKGTVAVTHLAERDDIMSMQTTVQRPMDNMLVTASAYNRLLSVSIHADGSMTGDSAYGLWPMEELFRAAGRHTDYPIFHLAHLLRLSDLIIPEELQRERGIPSWPKLPTHRAERNDYLKRLPGDFLRLQLPRIKVLQDTKAVTRAQRREIEEDKEFTGKQTRRAPAHVTWFWRRLPEGHKASPEMRTLAMEERGAYPPEGYTYVPERGIDPGYKAYRRPRTLP